MSAWGHCSSADEVTTRPSPHVVSVSQHSGETGVAPRPTGAFTPDRAPSRRTSSCTGGSYSMEIPTMRFRTMPILLGVLVLVPAVAGAQSAPAPENSRAAAIATEQAAKAKALQPYTPSSVERKIIWLKREFLELPSGFYPYFASVYSGGGFTLGAGLPAVLRRPDPRRREGALLDFGLQADRGQHRLVGARRRTARPARAGRAGATRRRSRFPRPRHRQS